MLPPLKPNRKNEEAKVTPFVKKWIYDNYPRSCEWEVKVGNNKVLPHQQIVLDKVVSGKYIQKHPDLGHRTGVDGHFMKDADALIIRCGTGDTLRICTVEVVNTGEKFSIKV